MGVFKRVKCPVCKGISGVSLPSGDEPESDNSGKITITCPYCGKAFEFQYDTKLHPEV
jgi:phage FluMu protein Com